MSTELQDFRELLSRVVSSGATLNPSARHLCGLSNHDRDDVIADACIAAWEHRDDFRPVADPTEEFAQWFAERVKVARQRHRRRAKRQVKINGYAFADAVTEIFSSDVERAAMRQHAAERVSAQMTDEDRKIAEALAAGQSVREIAAQLGVNRGHVRSVSKQLRRLVRAGGEPRVYPTCLPRPADSDDDEREAAPIDHEIERLLRRPTTDGADCPVCHLCSWTEGLLPSHSYKTVRVSEPEVLEALHNIADRKIAIANNLLLTGEMRPSDARAAVVALNAKPASMKQLKHLVRDEWFYWMGIVVGRRLAFGGIEPWVPPWRRPA